MAVLSIYSSCCLLYFHLRRVATVLLLSILPDLNAGGKILLSERFKPIPLSVWPIVLERANQRKGYYDSTNVLYHLLRYGPAMGKRHGTRASKLITARKSESSFAPSIPLTTAVDTDKTIGGVNSMIRVLPTDQFFTSGSVTFPTVTRKRKISMP